VTSIRHERFEENAAIIFSNLADNAMRHAVGARYIAARQGIRCGESHRQWRGRLAEQPDANLRQLLHDRRDSGGTGMGLAIVRAMLDAHGGAVRLSNSEQGTAFELTVPVATGRCRADRARLCRRTTLEMGP